MLSSKGQFIEMNLMSKLSHTRFNYKRYDNNDEY